MHRSSNYIHTEAYEIEMLSHADHEPERLNLSVKGWQHRQRYTMEVKCDLSLHLTLPSTSIQDSHRRESEIQTPDCM